MRQGGANGRREGFGHTWGTELYVWLTPVGNEISRCWQTYQTLY